MFISRVQSINCRFRILAASTFKGYFKVKNAIPIAIGRKLSKMPNQPYKQNQDGIAALT